MQSIFVICYDFIMEFFMAFSYFLYHNNIWSILFFLSACVRVQYQPLYDVAPTRKLAILSNKTCSFSHWRPSNKRCCAKRIFCGTSASAVVRSPAGICARHCVSFASMHSTHMRRNKKLSHPRHCQQNFRPLPPPPQPLAKPLRLEPLCSRRWQATHVFVHSRWNGRCIETFNLRVCLKHGAIGALQVTEFAYTDNNSETISGGGDDRRTSEHTIRR